jgi:hypothetical protein
MRNRFKDEQGVSGMKQPYAALGKNFERMLGEHRGRIIVLRDGEYGEVVGALLPQKLYGKLPLNSEERAGLYPDEDSAFTFVCTEDYCEIADRVEHNSSNHASPEA